VKSKKTSFRAMAYTFADTMYKYGQQLRQHDLGETYRRAGVAFKFQLQQKFVVLHDSCLPVVAPWSGVKLGLVPGICWQAIAKENWLVEAEALEKPKKRKSC
jgi:hypothetical protein